MTSVQLRGFSDASEEAYAGVVYLRLENTEGRVHTTLVVSKTKVSPIKRLSIPRLELCGAHVLANLLYHVKKALNVPTSSVFAWTDSSIVLSWLSGNPRRFKTYVGNHTSQILEHRGQEFPAGRGNQGMHPRGEREDLQDGIKVVIPTSHALAMKADLGIPWSILSQAMVACSSCCAHHGCR